MRAPFPADLTRDELVREIRTLRYRQKQLGKDLGRAGATIFALRNELAAIREVRGQISPGDYRRLLNEKRSVDTENRRLREKLAAKEEQA